LYELFKDPTPSLGIHVAQGGLPPDKGGRDGEKVHLITIQTINVGICVPKRCTYLNRGLIGTLRMVGKSSATPPFKRKVDCNISHNYIHEMEEGCRKNVIVSRINPPFSTR
jgi:hypothetical protein